MKWFQHWYIFFIIFLLNIFVDWLVLNNKTNFSSSVLFLFIFICSPGLSPSTYNSAKQVRWRKILFQLYFYAQIISSKRSSDLSHHDWFPVLTPIHICRYLWDQLIHKTNIHMKRCDMGNYKSSFTEFYDHKLN
jgi:hypothetical protein